MIISSIKKIFVSIIIFVTAVSAISLVAPQSVGAAGDGDVCKQSFLGFPNWYRGLTDGDCNVKTPKDKFPNEKDSGISRYIWTIVLNIIEMAMVLVVYLSVIYIIYGGVLYIYSAGSADKVKKAKTSITSALIGLVISIIAVAVVEFIFNRLQGL